MQHNSIYKILAGIVIVFFISCSSTKPLSNTLDVNQYYRKAYRYIYEDSCYTSFLDEHVKLSVSSQKLPSYILQRYFANELDIDLVQLSIKIQERTLSEDISYDASLGNIAPPVNSDAVVFFTEIEDDILLAEVYPNNEQDYLNQGTFGQSLAYLFKFNELGKIVDSTCQIINYN